MGRRKKLKKKLQIGVIYFLDRRIKSFKALKTVPSRQTSLNYSNGNVSVFNINGAPENNIVMVVAHDRFFGKEYSKIIASNKSDVVIGYILISDLQKIIKGKLKWVPIAEP